MTWILPEYEEIQAIGSGSTGSVILARDRVTGALVAVKYLSESVYRSAGFAERFRADSGVLAGIESDHVVALYEYVEGPDTAALVTEFVDGVSLRSVLDHGALGQPAALGVVYAALLGLADLHRHGVVHGDVRPENLLLDARGGLKVADTGVPGTGDPRYRAPESERDQPPTPASDGYAAAVTLLECLTGTTPRPYTDRAPRRHGRLGDREIDALRATGVDEAVQALLARELSTRPADRSADAAAFAEALDAAARAEYGPRWPDAAAVGLDSRLAPILLAGSKPADPGTAGRSKRRRTVLILGVVLLVLAGLAVFAVADGLFGPGRRPTASGPGSTAPPSGGPPPATASSGSPPGPAIGPAPAATRSTPPDPTGAGGTPAGGTPGGGAPAGGAPAGTIPSGPGAPVPPASGSASAPASPIHVTIVRTPRPAPVCQTIIRADVTVTGSLVDIGSVHLTYTINGVTKSTTVLITIADIAVPVVLDSAVTGRTSGSATVTVTGPVAGTPVTTTWAPTSGC